MIPQPLEQSLADSSDNWFLSQTFNGVPDLRPITVAVISDCQEGDHAALNRGHLVSRYIGTKAFLNIFSETLGITPTKSRVFLECYDPDPDTLYLKELPSQDTDRKLEDFGAGQGSRFFVMQVTEGDTSYYTRAKDFIRRYIPKKLTVCIENCATGQKTLFGNDDPFGNLFAPVASKKTSKNERRGGVVFDDDLTGALASINQNHFAPEIPAEYQNDPELWQAI